LLFVDFIRRTLQRERLQLRVGGQKLQLRVRGQGLQLRVGGQGFSSE